MGDHMSPKCGKLKILVKELFQLDQCFVTLELMNALPDGPATA